MGITTGLLAVVLVLVLLIFNVYSYSSQYQSIQSALEYALNVGPEGMYVPTIGEVFEEEFGPSDSDGDSDDGLGIDDSVGTMDASIPVYCVSITSEGLVKASSTNTTMDADLVTQAIMAVSVSGSSSGELSDLGLIYSVSDANGEVRIAFADSSSLHEDTTTRLLLSLAIGVGTLAILFLVSLWLSRFALKPVEQAWDGQQRFIADASHELKTPLTVILANTDIVKSHPDSTVEEQQRWIDSTNEEALRMQDLVKDLLVLAQTEPDNIQTFRANLKLEKLDFSALVEMNILQFEAVAFDKGVQIDDSIEEGLMVEGDQDKLDRVVRVLLDNACKYASKTVDSASAESMGDPAQGDLAQGGLAADAGMDPAASFGNTVLAVSVVCEDGDESAQPLDEEELEELLESGEFSDAEVVVTVKLRREKSNCVLTVNNGGEPIPAEDLPHVFEKFFRGDKARTGKSEGYGLGLSIAKNIVDGCGGSISVTSNATDGTTFRVVLPLA